MPFGIGVLGNHWRGSHAPDEILELTRDSNGDIFIKEKTSGETVMALRRTGANAYTLYNNTVAGGKIIQDSSMKNIASGIPGLDAGSKITPAQIDFFMTQTDQTASRAIGTVYQNTGAKPMLVSVSAISNAAATIVGLTDGSNPPTTEVQKAHQATATGNIFVCFVVLPGNYYKVTLGGVTTLQIWTEWT